MPFPARTWTLAAALAAGTALPALADVRAGVTLSDFGWSLIDLRPDDGLAPWVRFQPEGFEATGGASVLERPSAGQPAAGSRDVTDGWALRNGQGFFAPVDHQTGLDHTRVSAHQSGSAADGAFGVAVEGHAGNAAGDGLELNTFQLTARPVVALPGRVQGRYAIELSPWAELVWTGTLAAEVETTAARQQGLRREYALVDARIALLGANGRRVDAVDLRLLRQDQPPGLQRESRDLALNLVNAGAEATRARLNSHFHIRGFAYTTPAAIPEPGTWALLAGGLGMVAGVAARRRPRLETPCGLTGRCA